jgi:pimeloyl-ACP methyl ester carboxylesterase
VRVRRLLRLVFAILAICLLALVAAMVTFMWKANSREKEARTEAAPKTGRFVKVPGAEIFVQELGPASGPPILFVHGFGAWSETWRPTMQALADKGFRAVALDVPPFGFSAVTGDEGYSREEQARRLLALLDALELPRVTLLGHSYGGRPTVTAVLLAPDRVERLVLVDAAVGFESDPSPDREGPGLMQRMLGIGPLRHAILASLLTNPRMTRTLLNQFVTNPSSVSDDLVAIYQRPLVVQGATHSLGDWVKAQVDADDAILRDAETYKKLAMPALLIWGEHDTITPLWQGQRLAQWLPSSKLVVLPGIGHLPQAENPQAFQTALLEFLPP